MGACESGNKSKSNYSKGNDFKRKPTGEDENNNIDGGG